jgi:transposase-like protein
VNFLEVVHSVRFGKAGVAKHQRLSEARPNETHKNARLTPKGRVEMFRAVVDRGLSKASTARQFNTTGKTVAKWVGRFRKLGIASLRDKFSAPLSSPGQTSLEVCEQVELLRR